MSQNTPAYLFMYSLLERLRQEMRAQGFFECVQNTKPMAYPDGWDVDGCVDCALLMRPSWRVDSGSMPALPRTDCVPWAEPHDGERTQFDRPTYAELPKALITNFIDVFRSEESIVAFKPVLIQDSFAIMTPSLIKVQRRNGIYRDKHWDREYNDRPLLSLVPDEDERRELEGRFRDLPLEALGACVTIKRPGDEQAPTTGLQLFMSFYFHALIIDA